MSSQPSPAEVVGEERGGDEQVDESGGDEPFDEVEDVDVELADVDVGEPIRDDDGGGGPSEQVSEDEPFDHVEDEEVGAGGFDGIQGDHDDWGPGSGGPQQGPDPDAIAESINAGAARAAVIGLAEEYEVNGETQTKDDLRQEFEEVFEVANLGTFGAQSAEKYLQVEGEVDPLVGFAASLLACTALVLWMRPDGDQLVSNMSERLSDLDIPGQEFP